MDRPENDRRKFPRLKTEFPVKYRITGPFYLRNILGDSEKKALSLDISPIGIAIVVFEPVSISSCLSLEFPFFESDIPVKGLGQVTSRVERVGNIYRLGIRLDRVNDMRLRSSPGYIRWLETASN